MANRQCQSGQDELDFADQRRQMLENQLEKRGIDAPEILRAFAQVPRHCFVPPAARHRAYSDQPLPIGFGQTISQPYVVAYMLQSLRLPPAARVLEIGAGSGYQTALLAELAGQVYSLEYIPSLGDRALKLLEKLGYLNVELRIGNGHQGWLQAAPFDAIIGSAAAEKVPPALIEQLAPQGRLILPVGDYQQQLVLIERRADGIRQAELLPVRFVPMQGETS